MKNEVKCYRCAELEGCWAGLHDRGKINCDCFSPCASDKSKKDKNNNENQKIIE